MRLVCLVLLCTMLATRSYAQAPTVTARDGAMHLSAPSFHFITGSTLDQLRDGRSVRVELELSILPGPGGAFAHRTRERIALSYDLWEERFAATVTGPPARSVRNLTLADAEAWCLDQLTVALTALERERRAPFWIRLAYRIESADVDPDGDGGFTLRGLIDRMSRRTTTDAASGVTELGPFQLAH